MSKILRIITGLFIIIACTSCKDTKHYKVGEYLNDLAYFTGVNLNLNEEDSFNSLVEYEIICKEDKEYLDDDLRFNFLKRTINNFLNDENKTEYLLSNSSFKDNQLVNKEQAKIIIDHLVEEINNPKLEERTIVIEKGEVIHLNESSINQELKIGDVIYDENENKYKKVIAITNGTYDFSDATFDETYEKIDISGEYEINFEDAQIVEFNDTLDIANTNYEMASSYTNSRYELLGVKRHNFNKDGFNVAYTINSGSIDFRISKSIAKGMTMYFDSTISSVKPTYKWDNTKDNIEVFFKIDFDITNEVGVSTGKYNNYYLDFKDLNGNSFLSAVKKLNTKDDALEATIPICTIKTPIPNIPTASFNIDVLAKFYLSGKVEFVLVNNGVCGFELKDNKIRLIHDVEKDYDFTIGASTRTVAGLNFNICSGQYRLMDIEMDGGIRAALTPVLHLYDDDGGQSEVNVDEEYFALQEVSKENPNVALCADLTLNWVLEFNINTSKSLLYKYGFSRKKTLLDKSNQVFNNMTHIENFQFVKKCSRKNKNKIVKKDNTEIINSEKIILSKYSIVLIKGKSASIPIKSLPKGYNLEDLIYETSEMNVARVTSSGTIDSEELGTCKITIKTKDNKYSAYLNVLVSTG